VSTLEIFPRPELLAASVEAELDGGGLRAVALGQDRVTWRELVEAGWRASPRRARLDPRGGRLGERLLIDAVTDEARGPLGHLAGSAVLADGLRGAIAAWKRAGLDPAAVTAAARATGHEASRELARLYAIYAARLGDRADEADMVRVAAAALAQAPSLPLLEGVDAVVLHDVAALDAGELGLLDALLRRGLPARVRVPWGDDRPALEEAVASLLSLLESRHALPLEVEQIPLPPPGRASAPFVARLFLPRRRRAALPPLVFPGQETVPVTLLAAPSPEVEARAVARRVRDLLARGVAPGQVALVARSPERRARVAAWLSRYGVPVREGEGAAALDAPPVRLVLRLYDLVEEQVPREALIAALSSRYVAGGVPGSRGINPIPAHRVARALRQAGVRDGREEEGISGYRRRMDELCRSAGLRDRGALRRIADHIDALVAALVGLPEEGRLAEHVGALTALLERLELHTRTLGLDEGIWPGQDPTSQAPASEWADVLERARDQAAVAALFRSLGELGRAAARAGLGARRFTRRRFSRLLAALLGEQRLGVRGVRPEAVALLAPEAVAGGHYAHLFVLGIEDGELPARSPEDPLLDDAARRALNRAAGVEALSLAATREAQEPLTFVRALTAGEVLHLSWSTADLEGRPLAGSIFADELVRTLPGALLQPGHDPIPRAHDARTPGEMLGRVYLETVADPAGRLGAADPAVDEALGRAMRVRLGGLDARARAVVAIERDRFAFFGDPAAPPHAFVGGVGGGDPAGGTAELLRRLLPGGPHRPLSPSAVEDYAQCGFRFFLRRVLRGDAPEEAGDDLDALSAGRLHHHILERFFRTLVERGRWPLRGVAAETKLLDQVCDQIFDEWQDTERTGHPALFQARTRRIRREVHELVAAEGQALRDPRQGVSARLVPRWFERAFELRVPEPAAAGGAPLYLTGQIDRVDVESGAAGQPVAALVLDYKGGRLDRYRRKLGKEELLVTAFQLPIYGAAVRAELGVPVSAAYYSIREARRSPPLTDAAAMTLTLPAMDQAAAGEGTTLGDTLWDLRRRMLAGDFAVRPRTCELCDLEAACRVVVRPVDDEAT
jgi:superfamily I DNA/RNA helicase